MVDVFFSYKREERDRICPIINALVADGFNVWSDSKMLVTANIIKEVNARLQEARCIVVAWSTLSVQSDWVLDEAYDGFIRRCLVPLRIDDVAIPVPFARIETLDFSSWNGSRDVHDWRRLADAISHFCRNTAVLTPIAQRPPGTEAEDDELIAKTDGPAPQEPGPATGGAQNDRERAKELIMEELSKATKPVRCSGLAHKVHIALAKSVGKGNWFEQKTFHDFVATLQIPGYVLEKVPHPQLRRMELQDGDRSTTGLKPVPQLAPPEPIVTAPTADSFEQRLLAIVEIPRLEPAQFRSVFRGIATAIKAGKKEIGPITTSVRDSLRTTSQPIGLNRIRPVVRGAFFGGLQADLPMLSGSQVGYTYACSIYRQCAARNWELSVDECSQVHRLLGLEDDL